ncbi:MAG: hypothetical protein MMC23_001006 [Stictis urceolatum]|nr:hypothetical protein [Stictis urceolata]
MLNVPSTAIVSTKFSKKHPIAIGFATVGSSLGGVILPIVFRRLQSRVGFGRAVRVKAFITLTLGLGSLIIFCRKRGVAKAKAKLHIQPRSLLEPAFGLFCFGLFLQNLAYFVPLFYITSFAITKLGTSEDFAFYLLSVLNGSSFIGRTFAFWLNLANIQIESIYMLMFWNVVGIVLLFTWMTVTSNVGFILWCVVWGIISGVQVTMPTATLSHPAISPSLDVIGARIAMAWGSGTIGSLIGAPTAGALANVQAAGYVRAQVFAGAVLCGAVLSHLYPRITVRRYDRCILEQKSSESN